MVSVKFFASAAAIGLLSTAALAADLPPPQMYQPPPQIAYQPAPVVSSGWYLRGDVGVGVQSFGDFPHSQTNSAFVWPASWTIVQKDIQDTAIFGGGIGYEWNNWFRTDFTAEYRTKAAFKATGRFTEFCAGGGNCFDVTEGNFSSAVFMANAYLDLGTWWCLTPYIGAGVGGAYDRITGVQDLGVNSAGTVGFGLTSADCGELEPRLECPGRSHLQRQQQLQGRFQRPLPASGLAANGLGALPEYRVVPGRLLQSRQHQCLGFQNRPALDAAARHGPDDGAAPADEPGLTPSAETAN